MERIISPMRPQNDGFAVANLQAALLFIIDRAQLTPSNLSLAQWQRAAANEMAAQSLGERTKRFLQLSLPSLTRYRRFLDATGNGTGAGTKKIMRLFI